MRQQGFGEITVAIQILESQIVDRVVTEDGIDQLKENCAFQNVKRGKIGVHFKREVSLPSGKRMDLFAECSRKRFQWVIEFKQFADVSAVVQVQKYGEEVELRRRSIRRIGWVQKSIVARVFTRDAIFFAERLRISLIQFNQITPQDFELLPVVCFQDYPTKRRVCETLREFGDS